MDGRQTYQNMKEIIKRIASQWLCYMKTSKVCVGELEEDELLRLAGRSGASKIAVLYGADVYLGGKQLLRPCSNFWISGLQM